MTTVEDGSIVVFSKTTSSTYSASNPHNFVKPPNFDDITDLATQAQEITDVLSRLLSGQAKWKRGEVTGQCKLVLGSSIDEFCTFCKATVALLQTFCVVSRRVAAVLASISDPGCHPSVESFASDVHAQMESMFNRISSVEQHYMHSSSQLRTLMALVQDPKDLDKDQEVFQRLEVLWRVIAAQISSVLERRSDLPRPDVSLGAKYKWEEYQGYLLGAMDALNQCIDALSVSADVLKKQETPRSPYVKRGLIAFWSRLIQRISATNPVTMTDQVHKSMSHVCEQPSELILTNVVEGMRQSFEVVMGWQRVEIPQRFVIGSRAMRKLTVRVRELPVNFIITVHQSLETAKDGQGLCRRGWKASRILLGEEDHPEQVKSQFLDKTVEEIKESASALKQYTNDIYNEFRLLRSISLAIHKDLGKVTSEEQRSAFLARLSRHLSKDVRTCEDTLRQVQDDLGAIENSLNLITHWWQKVESDANHLQKNSDSSLTVEKNRIAVRDIRDSFIKLESYLDGYVDQIGVLYDENVVKLHTNNRKAATKIRDYPNLVVSDKVLLEPTRNR